MKLSKKTISSLQGSTATLLMEAFYLCAKEDRARAVELVGDGAECDSQAAIEVGSNHIAKAQSKITEFKRLLDTGNVSEITDFVADVFEADPVMANRACGLMHRAMIADLEDETKDRLGQSRLSCLAA